MNTNQTFNNPLWICVLMFVVGSTMKYDIPYFIVRVPLGELIAFLYVPVLLFTCPTPKLYQFRWVFVLIFIWALGVVVSDMNNGVGAADFARGIAKPAFCSIWCLFFVQILSRAPSSIFWMAVGAIPAAFQNYFFTQSHNIVDEFVGGGYGTIAYGFTPFIASATIFLVLVLYRYSALLSALPFVAGGVALAMIGAPRSATALMFLNAAILSYFWYMRRRKARIDFSLKKLIVYAVLGLGAIFALYYAYAYSASSGWLGETHYTKYQQQSTTIFGNSPLGLIIAGRTAVFAAVLGIIDNPIIGYGSWQGMQMGHLFIDAMYYVGTDANEISYMIERGGAGAGHSILFGSWMENGILVGGVLSVIALISLRMLIVAMAMEHPMLPWILNVMTGFLWAFFFSPFNQRMEIGFVLAFYIVYLAMPRRASF